jgi:hypothetical protein
MTNDQGSKFQTTLFIAKIIVPPDCFLAKYGQSSFPKLEYADWNFGLWGTRAELDLA